MIYQIPDPVLSARCSEISEVGEIERALGQELLDAMRSAPSCVGIAANQIGISTRAFCVDVSGHKKADSCSGEFVLFNPVVLGAKNPEVGREGCMSVPDLTGNVSRATEILVGGISMEGRPRLIEANAFEARAILHEIDHLDGLVFLDRVSSLGADVFKRKRYR